MTTFPAGGIDKSTLRTALLARRAALSAGQRETASRLIAGACRSLPGFADASIVCSYLSFRDEVDTLELVRDLLAAGRRVAVPAHLHEPGRPLVFSEIISLEGLEPSHFGVPQPPPAALRPVAAAAIPVFLVPGVGFDPAGNRIGFGLGFYDRALADAAPTARRIGLAFEAQITDRLPAEPHDVRMDLVITEDRVMAAPRGTDGPHQGGSRHAR